METWNDINQRQLKERIDLIESYNQRKFTQTEAAKALDISLSHLNNIVYRTGIQWRIRRQGVKTK